jgi:TrmH family RNA methyltransferase
MRAPRSHERIRPLASRHNALLQSLRCAFRRSEPTAEGGCAIEGVRLLEEAIRSGLTIQAVVFSASGLRHADRLLPQLAARTETVSVTDAVFDGLVETATPQGVAGLVRLPEHTLGSMLSGPSCLVVIAAGIQDPGNLGTLLRSAEAFAADGLVLTEGTVSRFNPKVIRSSAGSLFRLPCVEESLEPACAALRARGLRILGTTATGGDPLDATDLVSPCAILIGNEGAGLPREVLHGLDGRISIPHSSRVESLNAGVAASIVLYEAARQRRRTP